jgi:hypothetical protein
MMSPWKFVVITAVLIVVTGAGSHLLAQERTMVPPLLPDAHIRGVQQQVLRPPLGVGAIDLGQQGS